MADVVVSGTPVASVVSAPAQPTRAYRLRPNVQHTHDGRPLNAGDEIQLTVAQARAFADKFDVVDDKAEFKVLTDDERKKLAEAQAAKAQPVTGSAALPALAGNAPPGAPPEEVQAANAMNSRAKADHDAAVKKAVDEAHAKLAADNQQKMEEQKKVADAAAEEAQKKAEANAKAAAKK